MKIYVRVDDLDAYLNGAEKLGGRRLVPTCPVITAGSPSSPILAATG